MNFGDRVLVKGFGVGVVTELDQRMVTVQADGREIRTSREFVHAGDLVPPAAASAAPSFASAAEAAETVETVLLRIATAAEWFDEEGAQVLASEMHESHVHLRTAVAFLHAEAERAAAILPDDEVCPCLSETGSRQVHIYERCVRCGSFMADDSVLDRAEAAEARAARLEAALQRVKEFASDPEAGQQ